MARSRFFNRSHRRMREKITIQRKGDARDEMNAPTEAAWADVFTTKAASYPAPGTEKWAAAQEGAALLLLFEVRADSNTQSILPSDRVRRHKDGRFYNIVTLEQPESDSNIRIGTAVDIQGA